MQKTVLKNRTIIRDSGFKKRARKGPTKPIPIKSINEANKKESSRRGTTFA